MSNSENPAKTFLSRYRSLEARKKAAMWEIARIRAQATDTSIQLSADKVQSSGRIHDPMAENAAAIADATVQLDALVKEIDKALAEILEAIEAVPEEKQKAILTMRYVTGMKWEQIWPEMHYEAAQVYLLHGLALQHVREWMKHHSKS